ncbi:MAG TPA: hypothetical protein PK307_00845 [Spirochaetota bacterium]|nr:hypothetical protein [Spirochaetota bacterium]HPG50652.1 hypothetical protein [Spirochaetota bacterium]HPN11451.1 hypothetical protein [Spirochaetota bacterium]HQL80719.1 hypothetical protein [Spirochaetota bacterium]
MINIRETEESVLIEANDFNMPVQNLYNEILVRGKTMPEHEVRAFTSRIIGSMVLEGLVTLVKTRYRQEDTDVYAAESTRDCTPEEAGLILKEPDRWEEMDVFSITDTFELAITDKGRDRLDHFLS